MVARIIEYIYAGDAFQVVPSQRWSAPVADRGVLDLPRAARGQPEPVHVLPRLRRLRDRRREPRAADHGHRPATSRRGRSPARGRAAPTAEEDRQMAEELLADQKERAEHVMLVDLGRNDLGRVCEYGSVAVEDFMAVENYSHVMHIVSRVVRHAAPGRRRARRAALGAPGGHAVGRAEGPRDADHRRARAGQARRLRRRDRLRQLHRRSRHLHPHPHRRRQGRRRPRAGRAAARSPTPSPTTSSASQRRRRARCCRRSSSPSRSPTGPRPAPLPFRTVRVLVIDNYDSFTYNLVQYLGELEADIEVVRNDHATVDDLLIRGYDRVIVSPGPCTPHEAGISLEAVRRFPVAKIPTLGVCLGHQALVQAWGGRGHPARAGARQDDRDRARRPDDLPRAARAARGRPLPLAGRASRRCPRSSSAARSAATS